MKGSFTVKKNIIAAGLSLCLALSPVSFFSSNSNQEIFINKVHAEAQEQAQEQPVPAPMITLSAGSSDTGQIVVSSEDTRPVAIASTTKLMTYLVIKDLVASGKGSMEDPVVFDAEAAQTEGSRLGINEGDAAKAGTLLESVLIISANDSCVALAKHFGGSVEGFVKLMNQKAQDLGLSTAVFYTPNGLEDPNGNENTMSAHDLFMLSSYILNTYPEILEITSKTELVIPEYNFKEPNTNALLTTVPGVDGLKTGFTDRAGRCLVATGKKDADSPRVVSVLMGAESIEQRDSMSKDIMITLMNEYSTRTLFHKDKVLGREYINDSKYVYADLVPMEDINVFMRNDEDFMAEIEVIRDLSYPIEKGDKVGKISITHGASKNEFDLTVKEKISFFSAAKMWITGFLENL